MFVYLKNRKLGENEIDNVDIIKSIGAKLENNEKEDIVYLLGEKNKESNIFFENIYLLVSNGESGEVSSIEVRNGNGYNPKIFVSDFNGNRLDEILVTSESGGSGGYVNASLYAMRNSEIIEIFNIDIINNESNYRVEFKDGYIVEVMDIVDNRKYLIDISLKSKKYLNEIYTEKGKLKKALQGQVLSVGGVYSLYVDNDNASELVAVQRVIGLYNGDVLGYINSIIKFDNSDFKVIKKSFSIEGVEQGCCRCCQSIMNGIIKNKCSIDFSRVNFIEAEKVKDYKIERALEKEFNIKAGVDKVSYLYNRIDLNDNKNYNVMVYLEGARFCEGNGCTLAILEEKGDEYFLISKIVGSKNPIIISDEKTNGYKNIIMKIESGFGEGGYRELKFNGNAYPKSPKDEPRVKKGSKINGIAIIADDLFYVKGIEV